MFIQNTLCNRKFLVFQKRSHKKLYWRVISSKHCIISDHYSQYTCNVYDLFYGYKSKYIGYNFLTNANSVFENIFILGVKVLFWPHVKPNPSNKSFTNVFIKNVRISFMYFIFLSINLRFSFLYTCSYCVCCRDNR